jgi:FkbM family methyltransferase
MPSIARRAKVWLRSGSLSFARDYFERGGPQTRATYTWNSVPLQYRRGTSDVSLIYSILLKGGAKAEYALPAGCPLDPAKIGVVLDIGANIGASAVYFSRTFPAAVIHAFEPDPGNCELLRANAAAAGRIQVHEYALGAEDGTLTLFDSDDAANFGGYSAHSLGNTARGKPVPVRHAGRAVAALGAAKIDVIKIDTEGSEWEILTALGADLLRGVGVIMGELHGRKDFALLDFLQPMFHIGAVKQSRTRLFNFHAINRDLA